MKNYKTNLYYNKLLNRVNDNYIISHQQSLQKLIIHIFATHKVNKQIVNVYIYQCQTTHNLCY